MERYLIHTVHKALKFKTVSNVRFKNGTMRLVYLQWIKNYAISCEKIIHHICSESFTVFCIIFSEISFISGMFSVNYVCVLKFVFFPQVVMVNR